MSQKDILRPALVFPASHHPLLAPLDIHGPIQNYVAGGLPIPHKRYWMKQLRITTGTFLF